MGVDRFHIVFLFLSSPCTLSKEAFVYFVCPTEIPQLPFAWKYYDIGRYGSVGVASYCILSNLGTRNLFGYSDLR